MSNTNKLELFIKITEFLHYVCGNNYEIVLHDTKNPSSSIIAIKNGHISGRKIGGPMTDLALKLMNEKYYKENDYIVNSGRTKDGKFLASSTFFIKDENQELIGMLCINNNLSKVISYENYLEETLSSFGVNLHSNNGISTFENIENSVEDLMMNIINSAIISSNVPPERMSPEEKMEIVKQLESQGVFLLKGSVQEVANHLKASEATIYRYLNKSVV